MKSGERSLRVILSLEEDRSCLNFRKLPSTFLEEKIFPSMDPFVRNQEEIRILLKQIFREIKKRLHENGEFDFYLLIPSEHRQIFGFFRERCSEAFKKARLHLCDPAEYSLEELLARAAALPRREAKTSLPRARSRLSTLSEADSEKEALHFFAEAEAVLLLDAGYWRSGAQLYLKKNAAAGSAAQNEAKEDAEAILAEAAESEGRTATWIADKAETEGEEGRTSYDRAAYYGYHRLYLETASSVSALIFAALRVGLSARENLYYPTRLSELLDALPTCFERKNLLLSALGGEADAALLKQTASRFFLFLKEKDRPASQLLREEMKKFLPYVRAAHRHFPPQTKTCILLTGPLFQNYPEAALCLQKELSRQYLHEKVLLLAPRAAVRLL